MFRITGYAKIYKTEDRGKYVAARSNTYEKLQDGSYENSWWNTKFVGKSVDEAKLLKEKTTVNVTKGKIVNKDYVAKDGTKKQWLEVIIFEFEIPNKQGQTSNPKGNTDGWDTVGDDDDLPF